MNLVLHNIFYHYTILFKWITGFERIFHIHFNFYLFRNFSHRHLHGTIWRMALRRSPVLDQVFQNIFGLIFSVDRRGTCRPFHSRVSNVSNWYSPPMSTTLKLQTDVTSSIYPSFLIFFASMPPISPSTFFASTVDKIFQKISILMTSYHASCLSWKHTHLINMHRTSYILRPTHYIFTIMHVKPRLLIHIHRCKLGHAYSLIFINLKVIAL